MRIVPIPAGDTDRMAERSVEQAARNEVVFRDANEILEGRREELTEIAGRTPFLCECADPYCKEVVLLSLGEYERIRSAANRFFLAPGHRSRESEPVEETDRYVIVEKHGRSREIAEENDPRG